MTQDDNLGQTVEINLSSIKDFVANYKISLFFGLFGLILVCFGAYLLMQNPSSKDDSIKITQDEDKKAKIFVDVEGAVLKPGVYELKDKSRVKDALIAAGGLSQSADRSWVAKNLNLAAKISDGAKIYVPKKSEQTPASTTLGISTPDSTSGIQTSQGKININTASLSQLDTLSGVGPVTAQKIIDNRPYNSIDELVIKKAVWKSTFEKIKDKISTF